MEKNIILIGMMGCGKTTVGQLLSQRLNRPLADTDALIEERLSNRRVCEGCGATYHLINQPSSAGDLCERCGGMLTVRKDDKPETIRERLATYHQMTEPLVEYYRGQGKLCEIDGSTTIEAATEATLRILEGQE